MCKKYLGQINEIKSDFDKMNVQVVAVTTDPEGKAKKFATELGLNFELAYGLSIDQARDLGLYISTPMDSTETNQPFAEPGLFLIRPDGGLHFAEVSSAPFCRPDLEMIKTGIGFIQEKDYPACGKG
ncbi:MAG: peroxiredoxin [Oleiphilaceae bacterium]|jgi:peroxiredoxin